MLFSISNLSFGTRNRATAIHKTHTNLQQFVLHWQHAVCVARSFLATKLRGAQSKLGNPGIMCDDYLVGAWNFALPRLLHQKRKKSYSWRWEIDLQLIPIHGNPLQRLSARVACLIIGNFGAVRVIAMASALGPAPDPAEGHLYRGRSWVRVWLEHDLNIYFCASTHASYYNTSGWKCLLDREKTEEVLLYIYVYIFNNYIFIY